MTMTEIVCAYGPCHAEPADGELLCALHVAVLDRVLPDRLEKVSLPKGAGAVEAKFSNAELELLEIQVSRDALPLYMAAMQHLAIRGFLGILGDDD